MNLYLRKIGDTNRRKCGRIESVEDINRFVEIIQKYGVNDRKVESGVDWIVFDDIEENYGGVEIVYALADPNL